MMHSGCSEHLVCSEHAEVVLEFAAGFGKCSAVAERVDEDANGRCKLK